ncbi:hypothetical protein F5Y12DRAFT_713802 [Xylaria sp. FL1777]|nr:hypothetical protein F5Y12DRAFT_713802 [Xylaria sp. FL1777]
MALTNLGPLPTNFAVAASCSTDLGHVYKIYTSSEFYLLQGSLQQTSCYPSGYTANSRQYYSPGQCPTGFTSACQTFSSAGTVQETIVKCCPTQASFTCQSTFAHGWEETLGCVYPQDPSTTTVWTVSQVSNGRTARETYTDFVGGIHAYQIQVATTTSSTKSKSKTKSQTQPTTTKTSTGSGSGHGGKSSGSKSGLGAGGIAGIVIGAVAGVVAAAATPILLKMRRKLRRAPQDDDDDTQKSDPVALEKVHEKTAPEKPVEMDSDDVQPDTKIHRRPSV